MIYKNKQAFTLAETIMTLFIVGVVILAALPVFTHKKGGSDSELNVPWTVATTSNLNTGLYTSSNITIGQNISPAKYVYEKNNTGAGDDMFKSDFALTLYSDEKSFYNIFPSGFRNPKIAGYNFFEDTKNNLFITPTISSSTGSNNLIMGAENTISSGVNTATVIGNNNNLQTENSSYNTIFGSNNTASGTRNVIFGENNIAEGNSVAIGQYISSNNATVIGYKDDAGNRLSATNGLNIGNYITADSSSVTFNGNIKLNGIITGTFSSGSDIRLKNIKGTYNKGLKEVLTINPVIFTYKNDKINSLHTGVIAQEIQETFPEAVVKMPDGYYGVNSDPLFFAGFNAMKELNSQAQIEKARQEKLTAELEQLEQELAELKPGFWQTLWKNITDFFASLFKGGKDE